MFFKPGIPAAARIAFLAVALAGSAWTASVRGQAPPRISGAHFDASGEFVLELDGIAGRYYRIETSKDLAEWTPLVTFRAAQSVLHRDSGAHVETRYYRAAEIDGTGVLTGDHFATEMGDLVIHPVDHASFVMQWNGITIYNDPVGGSAPFAGIATANLILISHSHGDHFNSSTVNAVKADDAVIIAPQSVFNSLPSALRGATVVLANGASTDVFGLTVEAVPAYNLTTSNHPKGVGNGYVLTMGGARVYIGGDTEDIPEMRALENIDVAFVPMNVPYTMPVEKAADAVREFRPGIVYPYHFRNQNSTYADLDAFKRQVGDGLGIDVRVRDWY